MNDVSCIHHMKAQPVVHREKRTEEKDQSNGNLNRTPAAMNFGRSNQSTRFMPSGHEGFQVKKSIRQKLANSKRRIQRRLDKTNLRGCAKPIMTASNIHYEIAQRTRGLSVGGIGAIHALATRLGLGFDTFAGVLEGRWRSLVRANTLRVVIRTEVVPAARRPPDGPAYAQLAAIASPSLGRVSLRSVFLLLSCLLYTSPSPRD